MKKHLINIAKGAVIGLGMLAPGLSGGVFSVILGVYDSIIEGIKDLPRHPFLVAKRLWDIALGGIIGVALAFFILLKIIAWLPFPLTLLFIGFILGAVPKLLTRVKGKINWVLDPIIFIIPFVFIILLPSLPESTISLSNPWLNGIVMLLLGILLAATLIIPGVSGSMLFMALGFYFYLYQLAGATIDAFFSLDLVLMFSTGWPLIVLVVGLVIGLVGLANLLSYLLKNHSRKVYIAILGLLLASPYSIIVEALGEYPQALRGNLVWTIILAVVLSIIGFAIAFMMDRLEDKKDKEKV